MKGIKYISNYECTGYGIAAQRYLQGLIAANRPLTWTPMVKGNAWKLGYQPLLSKSVPDQHLSPYCNLEIAYDTVLLHLVPEYYPLWREREPDKKIIGYTVWETTEIPDHWPALLNSVDRLLVPCRWNRDVFINCGVTTPISVVPHIVSNEPLPPRTSYPGINEQDFVFYTINVWSTRKALWDTVTAYCETFTAQDDVVLIIKTSREDFTKKPLLRWFPPSSDSALRDLLRNYPTPPRIKLITDQLSNEQLLQLHGRGDCYISLCRAEGWGMGAFDAAGFGKPIIITNFGGQLDYLSPELSYLVDYRLVPVIEPIFSSSYSANQHWAMADVKQAGRMMRQVYRDRETAINKAQKQQQIIKQNFNAQVVTAQFLAALNS